MKCSRLSSLEGQEINKAKEILAFEVTKLVHGEDGGKEGAGGCTVLRSAAAVQTSALCRRLRI